jgi:hypothetical protein
MKRGAIVAAPLGSERVVRSHGRAGMSAATISRTGTRRNIRGDGPPVNRGADLFDDDPHNGAIPHYVCQCVRPGVLDIKGTESVQGFHG